MTEGAKRLGEPLADYLRRLMAAGLKTLPGTAAEILDDEIRAILCPDKVNTEEWLDAHRTAHGVGLRSNITIMFGSVEQPVHWARHLVRTRALQKETGGFTEFVPLPFVHMASPIYLQRKSRRGPTFRETLLMHAVGRIAYHGWVPNIQVSWVKMGAAGRGPAAPGRLQRPGRHPHGREHLPGRRRQPRPAHGRGRASGAWSSRSAAGWSSAPPSTGGSPPAKRAPAAGFHSTRGGYFPSSAMKPGGAATPTTPRAACPRWPGCSADAGPARPGHAAGVDRERPALGQAVLRSLGHRAASGAGRAEPTGHGARAYGPAPGGRRRATLSGT